MMMIIMIRCFFGKVNQQKVFSLISSQGHCQGFLPSQISDMPRAGFEATENLNSRFVEWSFAVVITTTPRHHMDDSKYCSGGIQGKFNKFKFNDWSRVWKNLINTGFPKKKRNG